MLIRYGVYKITVDNYDNKKGPMTISDNIKMFGRPACYSEDDVKRLARGVLLQVVEHQVLGNGNGEARVYRNGDELVTTYIAKDREVFESPTDWPNADTEDDLNKACVAIKGLQSRSDEAQALVDQAHSLLVQAYTIEQRERLLLWRSQGYRG